MVLENCILAVEIVVVGRVGKGGLMIESAKV